jgi:hypothetical protein
MREATITVQEPERPVFNFPKERIGVFRIGYGNAAMREPDALRAEFERRCCGNNRMGRYHPGIREL